MISGLCGFADLIRRHGGDVGAAELVDAARSFTLIDLADRLAVERALRMNFSWATVQPEAFQELFSVWFTGAALDTSEVGSGGDDDVAAIGVDADMIDAARIHTEDALAIDDGTGESAGADGATADDGIRSSAPAPTRPSPDGVPVGAQGELAPTPPTDEAAELQHRRAEVVVALPDAPPAVDVELARTAFASAIDRRRQIMVAPVASPRVTALTEPLSRLERERLAALVRRLDRQLRGAPSWRHRPARYGAVDLRRTIRRSVTTGGRPIDVRHTGRRLDAARLVVLADVSLSVRGTSRLVLHLVHRLRSSVGSLRAFGFIDAFVPIDRALRTDDPIDAIEQVMGLVDVHATSDPGRALRSWWSRWHHLVTPQAHVLILSDGRCNGRDPAFDTVRRITARSASTVWISPEPVGAWTLGRGEMAEYAACVDRAVTVRSIDDLGAFIAPDGR